MLVVFKGKSKCLMTDYNGKRYCFEKNKPIEISDELYKHIILSEHIESAELCPVSELPKPEPEESSKPDIKSPQPRKWDRRKKK